MRRVHDATQHDAAAISASSVGHSANAARREGGGSAAHREACTSGASRSCKAGDPAKGRRAGRGASRRVEQRGESGGCLGGFGWVAERTSSMLPRHAQRTSKWRSSRGPTPHLPQPQPPSSSGSAPISALPWASSLGVHRRQTGSSSIASSSGWCAMSSTNSRQTRSTGCSAPSAGSTGALLAHHAAGSKSPPRLALANSSSWSFLYISTGGGSRRARSPIVARPPASPSSPAASAVAAAAEASAAAAAALESARPPGRRAVGGAPAASRSVTEPCGEPSTEPGGLTRPSPSSGRAVSRIAPFRPQASRSKSLDSFTASRGSQAGKLTKARPSTALGDVSSRRSQAREKSKKLQL